MGNLRRLEAATTAQDPAHGFTGIRKWTGVATMPTIHDALLNLAEGGVGPSVP